MTESHLFKEFETFSGDRALCSASAALQLSSLLRAFKEKYSRCPFKADKDTGFISVAAR